jgi:putative peptidoglycan binding protein
MIALVLGLGATLARADEFDVVDYGVFRSLDPLAQRDEWGTTHQMPRVIATDFAARYRWRWIYYFKAPEQLVLQPAYVGSMQTALRRLGYYCGPIDGVFTPEVSDAIARLQKNYSMRVTGTLTTPVRRALFMP